MVENFESVKLLLACNAQVNSLDNEGRTPVACACARTWDSDNIRKRVLVFPEKADVKIIYKDLIEYLRIISLLFDNGRKRVRRPEFRSDMIDEGRGIRKTGSHIWKT